MKKDLLIGGGFVLLAILGISGVVYWFNRPANEAMTQTIKPKVEPIVLRPEKPLNDDAKPRKPPEKLKKIPIQPVAEQKKPAKPSEPKNEEPKRITRVEAKKEQPRPVVKIEPKKEVTIIAKAEVKVEPKKLAQVLDIIELPPHHVKIKRPDGEYSVRRLSEQDRVILLGKVKVLKLNGVAGSAVLDASELEAEEIHVTGAISGNARVKLHAPHGSVILKTEINGSSELEVIAPDGKVVFNNSVIVTGGAKVVVVTRHLELNGEINNSGFVSVTLTAGGSLKFTKLQGGARLHYARAVSSDPEPRIEQGIIAAGTELRKLEPVKK